MKCCENCMNNPNNNPYASGFCHCALPAMELQSPRRKFKIGWIPTWTQTTTGTNIGSYIFSTSTDCDYQRAVEQLEHDILYESTFNPDDGSM